MAEVLWDDGRVLAVAKPAGVSLATRRDEPGAAVARLLDTLDRVEREARGLDPSSLLLVHRLDVGTSGVVLLARDPETHRDLVGAFAERKVGKTYLALAWGKPRPREGRWDWPLGPDRKDRRRMRVDPAGRRAATAYRVLGTGPHASLVELAPETGRTHQIRVHMAHAGHLIVGDDLYGGPRHHAVRDPALRRALDPGRPLLHAWRLHLPPRSFTGELILTAPLPDDFEGALRAVRIAVPE